MVGITLETSSDESFAWTDTSSDSDDDIRSRLNMNNTHNTTDESEYGKMLKKKLQNLLFEDDEKAEKQSSRKSKKRKIKEETPTDTETEGHKKRRIKSEPESDVDSTINHKLQSKKIQDNLDPDTQDSMSAEENFLNIPVKKEQAIFASSISANSKMYENDTNLGSNDTLKNDSHSKRKKAKKNKKMRSDHNEQNDLNHVKQESDDSSRVKKKKSKKKRNSSAMDSDTETIIEDKFSAEDTVVETPRDWNKDRKSSNSVEAASEPDARPREENVSAKSKKNKRNSNSNLVDEDGTDFKLMNGDLPDRYNQRTSKISERIIFEDESMSMGENEAGAHEFSDNEIHRSAKLKQFLQINSNLTPITSKMQNNAILSGDDNIWILRCPREINAKNLKGVELALEGKCKLKIDGQTYEGSIDKEESGVAVLSSNYNNFIINNMSVNGIVSFRKKIPKAHFVKDNILMNNQTNFIPLPETKCRHPLFGSNFKQAIKLPSAVSKRLRDIMSSALEHTSPKKKHKKEKSGSKSLQTRNPAECDAEPDVIHNTVKKKRKRKHENENSSHESAHRHTKRRKLEPHSSDADADAWGTEQAIEQNLFSF